MARSRMRSSSSGASSTSTYMVRTMVEKCTLVHAFVIPNAVRNPSPGYGFLAKARNDKRLPVADRKAHGRHVIDRLALGPPLGKGGPVLFASLLDLRQQRRLV